MHDRGYQKARKLLHAVLLSEMGHRAVSGHPQLRSQGQRLLSPSRQTDRQEASHGISCVRRARGGNRRSARRNPRRSSGARRRLHHRSRSGLPRDWRQHDRRSQHHPACRAVRHDTTAGDPQPSMLVVSSRIAPPSGHRDSVVGIQAAGYTFDVAAAPGQGVLDLNAVDFADYDVIVVASDFGGILRQEELTILNARARTSSTSSTTAAASSPSPRATRARTSLPAAATSTSCRSWRRRSRRTRPSSATRSRPSARRLGSPTPTSTATRRTRCSRRRTGSRSSTSTTSRRSASCRWPCATSGSVPAASPRRASSTIRHTPKAMRARRRRSRSACG